MWEAGKRKKRIIGIVILALLALALFTVYRWYKGQEKKRLEYERNVTVGDLPGKDREARKRELQELVDKSRISFSINATPVREKGEKEVNWMLENPKKNGKLLKTRIFRKDNGSCIYETKAMRPGTYLESGRLKKELPSGEYACTAFFYAYDEESEEYIGKAGAEVLLVVR